jgi:Zn-dependent peptidase ImmA (M78 family)/transcriptional regulator with XRE-family HTH domain
MPAPRRTKPSNADDPTSAVTNPAMVRLARESAGLSQGELAVAVGISQSKISKIEAGLLAPSSDDLRALADHLRYPPSFFAWTDRLYGFETHEVFHRRRQAMTAKALDRVHAEMNIKRMQLERLLRSLDVGDVTIPSFDPDEYDGDIERIAQLTRAVLRMPRGPIDSMVAAIEEAGGVVLPYDFGTQKVDAMSHWAPGAPPVFYVNTAFPADRTRWSMAHELGHIVMHKTIGPDAEDEANRFAEEFLVPADEVRHQLRRVTITELAMLKPFWKVSIAALIKRSKSLGLIAQEQERRLWVRMSALGYRKQEPIELDREEPRLYRLLVETHLQSLGYSSDELREAIADLRDYWVSPPGRDAGVHLALVH